MRLTTKQRFALSKLKLGPCFPWDFGSTTVNRLRAAGLIVTSADRRIELTAAGRANVAGYASGRGDAGDGKWPQPDAAAEGHGAEPAAFGSGYREGYAAWGLRTGPVTGWR